MATFVSYLWQPATVWGSSMLKVYTPLPEHSFIGLSYVRNLRS